MIQKTKRSIKWVHEKKRKYAGIHLIVEFWGAKVIENSKEIEKILILATKKTRSTLLKVAVHKFKPQGISGVVLLAESHMAIHYWPEFHYLAIDIFTCGNKSVPERALQYFEQRFKPKKIEIKRIKRGYFKNGKNLVQ